MDEVLASEQLVDTAAPTDEEAARQARQQYREHGLPRLEPDELVLPHLAEGEELLGWRETSVLGHIDSTSHRSVRDTGPLYITSVRLLHIGAEVTSLELAEIAELAMADDRILVTTIHNGGLVLDVTGPRQLRVLIAAAKGALRG